MPQLVLAIRNEPQKMAAGLLFILTFFLFMLEIMSSFRSHEQVLVVSQTIAEKKVVITDHSALFTTPLFGQYVPDDLSDSNVKQSSLDMQVVGVMFSDNEKQSQVVIRIGGGEQQAYQEGDVLPGGVIIKRIVEGGVLLLHEGRLESLSLPKAALAFSVPPKLLFETR